MYRIKVGTEQKNNLYGWADTAEEANKIIREYIKKQEKDTWINYNNIILFKKKYNANLNSIISVKTPIKKSYVNPSLFVDKSNKICYYDYRMVIVWQIVIWLKKQFNL